jgi:thiol-disulfide isomerase/thioredoxin
MTAKMSTAMRARAVIVGTLLFWVATGVFAQAMSNILDAQGKVYSNSELKLHKATVFIFLATDCPNSNSYAPEMIRLSQEYESRGVAFYGVYSDPAETSAGVRKHDVDYGIRFPSLMDSQQILARETGALGTPESVILSPSGKVLYRGRIDNRFAVYGKTRLHVDQHDLRTALDEVLAGKPVAHPYEPSLGCAIPGVFK